VAELLPPTLSSFRTGTRFSLAQMWFGNQALHYEAWIRSRLGVIELGLHFEADPLTNARLLAAFRARERTVLRTLGPDARVEEWDKGWTRVWESIALARLDEEHLAPVAARLARYMTALEPILRDALPSDVAWSESRGSRASPARAARTRAKQGRPVAYRGSRRR
jgi:hypothetical protein